VSGDQSSHHLDPVPIASYYKKRGMLRPRRSQPTKTGGRNNMLSWDEVNIEGSEHEEGSDNSLDDESTEFGSDDIYSPFF
jgi:hypothetical protein